jgi:hypothetical protein
MYYEPIVDYWTVDVCTPNGKSFYAKRCTWKFQYEQGYDPSEYVHSIWNRYCISLGDGKYVHDRSSQHYLFTNYVKVDDKEMYDNLNLERLLPDGFVTTFSR